MVAKLGEGPHPFKDERTDYAVVEDLGYWDKAKADARARLLAKDGVLATVWPVRFWAPLKVWADPVPPPALIPVGAVTEGEGQKLHAYDEGVRHRLLMKPASEQQLSTVVTSLWHAWRLQQADAGNFDEAAQAGPSEPELATLYQESSGSPPPQAPKQLSLPGFEKPRR